MSPKRIADTARPGVSLHAYRDGPLEAFLAVEPLFDLSRTPDALPDEASQAALFAPWLLQDIADYRGALQRWFAAVRIGGVLVVTVPHAFLYERQDAAPSRLRPAQRRLYTPRALIEEIEEAFPPNSYRLRWLGDLDAGYDYAAEAATGRHDVAAVIERIAPPDWSLAKVLPSKPAPHDLFEPDRTRVEALARAPAQRILALKLDHLGDFVLGIPALERLRAAFPDAAITLVVGSWNEGVARALGLADEVVVFDAYPRNSAEEPIDVAGKTALFDALIAESYDLAVDLRTDPETRFLLRNVKAPLKAGLGLRAHHYFLDIALPIEPDLGHFDTAWSEEFGPDRFQARDYCARSRFSIVCPGERARDDGNALVWGPYRPLPPGDYMFEPYVEIEPGRTGLLACDVALNTRRVAYAVHPQAGTVQLAFENKDDHAQFEFRLQPVAGEPIADFRFYGGRLWKRGAGSALHQSEYLILLVDLIALRVREAGVFGEVRP